tara:strand:+ start:254 stop:886 length:633 start_codon:yes stop_codon:yes gene_type:complete
MSGIYTEDDIQGLFDVSRETLEKIRIYHTLLLKWNKAINLVSPKTISESWHRHFIDSAQVSQFIPSDIRVYADLGCGGGFPGLVIAMMRPDLDVHLVESDERKGQFMRSVSRETSLNNVTIHTKRVEAVIDDFAPDFVTARALASLGVLFDYVFPWVSLNPTIQLGLMKGERADDEILEAQKRYRFTIRKHDSITDQGAKILLIDGLALK